MVGLLVWVIIVIVIIMQVKNKNKNAKPGVAPARQRGQMPVQNRRPGQMPVQNRQPVQGRSPQPVQAGRKDSGQLTGAAPQSADANTQAKQAELKRRLMERYQTKPQAVGKKVDILVKANANASEDFNNDTFTQEAVHNREKSPDLPDDCDLMKQVQDLIVMGYQCNLEFRRDFIGEATEMLNSFIA